ncbi:MAG: sulfatase [Bacteroidia bacterium]|nr:MAG: sulfatase [Bacteroidia bacterium]
MLQLIKKKIKLPSNITIILKVYLLALTIFFIFRCILFFSEWHRIDNTISISDILYAFWMGIRFDTVICGYILLLSYLLLTIHFIWKKGKLLLNFIFYFTFILFSIAFLVCTADIPYFKQFFSRFSITAFEWADHPKFVIKMIIQEPRYWMYIIPYAIVLIIFHKILRRIIFSNNIKEKTSIQSWTQIILSIVFIGVILLTIRGRIEKKSPIRVGTAYFCNNPFLNQLGLNPNFTLIQSILDKLKEENKPIKLIADEIAIANVQRYLNINNPDSVYPVLRKHKKIDSLPETKSNIIIVIMESMSAAKTGIHGNNDNLTPFLDSIAKHSYYFENAYTAGIHTFNGIFSTLFSYPAIFKKHPMKGSFIPKFHGIATSLKQHGYSTIYFTTHDGQFDNVEGFLLANDFEKVVSQKDYPSQKIKTTLGVPDDFMFEFSIPILNELHKKGKPFFSVFLTASDHGPYYIPEYFKPKPSDIKKQIVEYADYSLKKFFHLAKQQSWYNNTLFVFIADHGAPLSAIYELSLDYNHTPLIFYHPNLIKHPKIYSKMAGQIDVFPSIMGFLNLPFDNYTLGIDLFHEERPYIYFNADDKYGVIDQNWLLIVRENNTVAGLFKYKEKDLKNYENEFPDVVEQMKKYGESNIQTFQYLLKKKKI